MDDLTKKHLQDILTAAIYTSEVPLKEIYKSSVKQ